MVIQPSQTLHILAYISVEFANRLQTHLKRVLRRFCFSRDCFTTFILFPFFNYPNCTGTRRAGAYKTDVTFYYH